MTKWIKNEATSTKRRCSLFVYLDDGVTPAPSATVFGATAAFAALVGTHHGTLTWIVTGSSHNGSTIELIADGSGSGALNIVGGTNFKFHYQSGVTTMANFVTAAASYFTFSGHTPSDVLAATGDTQGPIVFAGGNDFGVTIFGAGGAYAAAAGSIVSTGRDGHWIYTATQAETNVAVNEVVVRIDKTGFYSPPTFVEIDDGAVSATFINQLWEGTFLEASHTPGDLLRLAVSGIFGPAEDFRTNTIVVKNLDGSKIRGTLTVGTEGRLIFTPGDLS